MRRDAAFMPVIEDAPIARSEAAVVANAHGVHLAMNVFVLPLKARGLTNIELAIAEAVGNASLLVELGVGRWPAFVRHARASERW